ncbi:MAG: amino acid ABC transporter substrate-binding protein [Chloroflexi bacterium]|nr:amino acid ABC transporter substrate-binding protein [Chloroflexota bacterium]
MKKTSRLFVLALALALVAVMAFPAASPQPAQAQGGSVLDQVLARGSLNCGVNGQLPGFGYLDTNTSEWSGLDVDFCRAIAAALFGEVTPENLIFVPTTAQERFTAVQTGTVDVLLRNATWTLQRDTELGLDLGPVVFYDGQGLMVRADSGATTAADLGGASICTLTGTTTALNISELMGSLGLEYELVVFEQASQTIAALEEGRCDALTSDRSQLASLRTTAADPGAYIILDDVISKEPLAPAYIETDAKWANVVSWVVYATIQAEEFGITQADVDSFLTSEDPAIQRFLGVGENVSGTLLGLDNDFVVNVIRAVGNYGEIYERNVGPNTPLALDRGINNLWTNGGLIYAPAWR